MGWKHRDWFPAVGPALIYDQAGNIGSWASTSDGIRVEIVADRGRQAVAAVEDAANHLQQRLDGVTVTSAVRTPLERRLSSCGR